MDPFSKIILGTDAWFQTRQDLPEAVRNESQQFALRTKWLVGVVATSESLPEDFFRHVALEVARKLGGRVFLDGREFVAPKPEA